LWHASCILLGSDSRWGLRFFLCPMLVTYWIFHPSHFFPSLKFTTLLPLLSSQSCFPSRSLLKSWLNGTSWHWRSSFQDSLTYKQGGVEEDFNHLGFLLMFIHPNDYTPFIMFCGAGIVSLILEGNVRHYFPT